MLKVATIFLWVLMLGVGGAELENNGVFKDYMDAAAFGVVMGFLLAVILGWEER